MTDAHVFCVLCWVSCSCVLIGPKFDPRDRVMLRLPSSGHQTRSAHESITHWIYSTYMMARSVREGLREGVSFHAADQTNRI